MEESAASNREELALSSADSETDTLISPAIEVQPGSNVLTAFLAAIGKHALEERTKKLAPHFVTRTFFPISSASAVRER